MRLPSRRRSAHEGLLVTKLQAESCFCLTALPARQAESCLSTRRCLRTTHCLIPRQAPRVSQRSRGGAITRRAQESRTPSVSVRSAQKSCCSRSQPFKNN
eukprot:Amastigsp_a3618_15.p7 type:complete len:100 gc:universal Amastigsp_a3618_15:1165-866(-)